MPQAAGQFRPSYWTNPRPPMMGQSVAAVVPVGGGDGRHLFKRQPEPGAPGWALLPSNTGMPFAIQGPGYIVRDNTASHVFSGPQVQWSKAEVASGYAGLVYGGSYQQGLIDWNAYFSGNGAAPTGAGRG